jgi:predicted TIM-barrel fold metal-dependent hydrolase
MSDGPAKRKEGRDEVILDPALPIVDPHHHFYDLPHTRYMFEDYLADADAGHNIVASTYVATQAMIRQDGPEVLRPLGEIEFANGIAAMSASGNYGPRRVCAAIVGYADLTQGDPVAELLDRALATAPERFRGVRQSSLDPPNDNVFRYVLSTQRPARGILRNPAFRDGFRHLAPRGLTFDASIFHHQVPELADVADSFPDTTIVLNHMSIALGLDMDEEGRTGVFHEWREGLAALARYPNLVCKVGGLGMPFWGLGFETRADPVGYLELAERWRPYVEAAIGAFGPDRCMMESNFPPDGRSCGFVPLWNALKHVTRGYSQDEKAALFHRTASRVYRIRQPEFQI